MDYFEYQTFFDSYEADGQTGGREGTAWLEFFSKNVRRQLSPTLADRYILKAEAECRWMEDGRQFYAVEPEELVDVTITSLEHDCRELILPCPQFEIRFPRPDGFAFEDLNIQSLFVTEMLVRKSPGLGIWCNFGKRATHFRNYPASSYWYVSLAFPTIEDTLVQFQKPSGDSRDHNVDALRASLKAILWTCFLDEDYDPLRGDFGDQE